MPNPPIGSDGMVSHDLAIPLRANSPSVEAIWPSNWIRIDATKRRWFPDPKELWEYRSLLYSFAWRDIKIRYKETWLGMLWVLLQPTLTMLVFTLFLGRLARSSSDGLPYPVFAYTGLVIWSFFASSFTLSAKCLLSNLNVLTKAYFPRVFLPLSTLLSAAVDLLICLSLLFLLLPFFHLWSFGHLWALPFVLLLAAITALGSGLWIAALNFRYRDINYLLPFLMQLWLLSTPVAFSTSLLPAKLQFLYAVNPMVGVVEGFRWAILGRCSAHLSTILLSTVTAIVLNLSGLFYFQRCESNFGDWA